MKQQSKAYEQFCWVKQKNIIMEETLFYDGSKSVICTNLSECNSSGGCKNKILNRYWCKENKAYSLFLTENLLTID